mgnify:CR=1 FL=1
MYVPSITKSSQNPVKLKGNNDHGSLDNIPNLKHVAILNNSIWTSLATMSALYEIDIISNNQVTGPSSASSKSISEVPSIKISFLISYWPRPVRVKEDTITFISPSP